MPKPAAENGKPANRTSGNKRWGIPKAWNLPKPAALEKIIPLSLIQTKVLQQPRLTQPRPELNQKN